jgi:hypothetical protein
LAEGEYRGPTINKGDCVIPDTAAQNKPTNLPVKAVAIGRTVVYTYQDKTTIKLQGLHPNRDNNPGDIVTGYFTRQHGAIGNDVHFAIFPDPQTGWQALVALLKTPAYRLKTIREAIKIYAPKHENNTEKYIKELCRMTSHKDTDRLSSFTSLQMITMAKTIATIEGWKGEGYKQP